MILILPVISFCGILLKYVLKKAILAAVILLYLSREKRPQKGIKECTRRSRTTILRPDIKVSFFVLFILNFCTKFKNKTKNMLFLNDMPPFMGEPTLYGISFEY